MSTRSPVDAVVVGSGPNGLAAAVALAQADLSVVVLERAETVGGGARSAELTVPGLVHDTCSAVHPLAVASPYLTSLPLADHGLTWLWAEIDLAHPLDDGRAALLHRSMDRTVQGLGPDGAAWQRTFGRFAESFEDLAADVMGPILRTPKHPMLLGRFGSRALLPATVLARRWRTDEARALFGGIAAHAMQPLTKPMTSAVGLVLGAASHHRGWPVAKGGSQAISDALASLLRSHGGTIETGVDVRALRDLPPHRVALFDVAPGAFARIAGDRLPSRVARAYRRYHHGPAAFKVDFAVEGGVPWRAEDVERAGTVHVGGTLEETVAAEAEVGRGRMPERPFVLVGQQYVADPGRSVGSTHPVWAYAHLPAGWNGDATEAVAGQIERFAPGFRDRIVATAVSGPADLAAKNPNYVGGDIGTGANTPGQLVFRPRLAVNPYATGIDGVYLCSAATPPGAGVHGMGGYHAARTALAWLSADARGGDHSVTSGEGE